MPRDCTVQVIMPLRNEQSRFNSGIPYMFLLPFVIEAGLYEFGEAIKSTENSLPSKTQIIATIGANSQVQAVTPHVSRRFVDSSDQSTVPSAPVEESMSDKQIVVFGTDKHPGINSAVVAPTGDYVGWKNEVTSAQLSNIAPNHEPLVKRACLAVVEATFPGFTPSWVKSTGAELCFRSLKYLATNGIPIIQRNIINKVSELWETMSKKVKNAMPKKMVTKAAAKLITQKNKVVANPKNYGYMANVTMPAATANVVGRMGNPRMSNKTRGVVITHSEMVNTLVSSSTASAFSTYSFVINPAKADVFPWLSSVAVNYDKYRIKRLAVHLNAMQPTSKAGKMGVSFDPDSTDDLPVDRGEVYAMYKHVEGPLWQSLSFEIPVTGQEKFCNTHSSVDSKLIDEGMFVVFSDLAEASLSLCDVIVDYTVELLDPQQALFSTANYALSGIPATAGLVITPARSLGPKLATFFTASSTAFYVVPSPGYYAMTVMFYDAGAGTPTITFHNGTAYTALAQGCKSTTNTTLSVIFRIGSNNVKPTLGTFTGEYTSLAVGTVANLAALEAINITLSRVSPTLYASTVTTGFTTVAIGGDVVTA